MTAPVRFKQSDLRRALRAAREEGFDVKRAEIGSDGEIRLYFSDDQPLGDLDRWRQGKHARAA